MFANTVAPPSEKLCSEVLNALATFAALPVALTIRLFGSTVTPLSPWFWRYVVTCATSAAVGPYWAFT